MNAVFSIKGSLKIDDHEIRGIEEDKDEDERFNAQRVVMQEQSFHYKKGIAMQQREISNRQPA